MVVQVTLVKMVHQDSAEMMEELERLEDLGSKDNLETLVEMEIKANQVRQVIPESVVKMDNQDVMDNLELMDFLVNLVNLEN